MVCDGLRKDIWNINGNINAVKWPGWLFKSGDEGNPYRLQNEKPTLPTVWFFLSLITPQTPANAVEQELTVAERRNMM